MSSRIARTMSMERNPFSAKNQIVRNNDLFFPRLSERKECMKSFYLLQALRENNKDISNCKKAAIEINSK